MQNISSRGTIIFAYILMFRLGNVYDTYKITYGDFFSLENVWGGGGVKIAIFSNTYLLNTPRANE